MQPLKFLPAFLLVAGIIAAVFYGCKKETQKNPTVTSNATDSTFNGVGIALTIDPDPATVGAPYTVLGSVNAFSCGDVEIDQARYSANSPDGGLTYHLGDPAPAAAVNSGIASWAVVSSGYTGGAAINYQTTPTVSGLVGYREVFSNPDYACSHFGPASVTADATINPACTNSIAPTLVTATLVTGTTDKKGTTYNFKVTFTVSSCTAGIVGKLQGGLIAGATNVALSSSTGAVGAVRQTSKNAIISWPNAVPGSYTVTYSAHIPGVASPGTSITGAWSYTWDPGLYGGTGTYGYTSPVMFSY